MLADPIAIRKEIFESLTSVIDPELNADIVELKMVQDVMVDDELNVRVLIGLTTAKCPLRNKIRDDIVKAIEGTENRQSLKDIKVITSELSKDAKSELMDRARKIAQTNNSVNVSALSNTRILAISSGKGGVGKSSVAANLALGLAYLGNNVGILDADIWGFSIPRLLGLSGELKVRDKKIVPLQHAVAQGKLSVISMGFLASENSAIMWRGLILNRAVQHFLEDVSWEDLNYLIIDMPPGTGDIQMGLAKMLPKTEVIIVTTPSEMVEQIASRTAQMAKKSNIRTVGVIENMSYFQCDHDQKYYLFGKDGGLRLAQTLKVPLLSQLPIDPEFSENANISKWHSMHEMSASQDCFVNLAQRILEEFPYTKVEGCTARILSIFDKIDTKSNGT